MDGEPGTAGEDIFAAALERRDEGGTLHLTLSFMVEYERLQQAVADAGGASLWDRDLVRQLRDHEDSRRLGNAIEPLFNDIADRKRGLFMEEFLIDTPGGGDTPHDQNTCDDIELVLPPSIHWRTEGEHFGIELAEPPCFQARCRAFWVAHSNTSLTWHLSLELPYAHHHAHYYGLSLLQKAVFPTEGTRWLYDGGAEGIAVRSRAFPADAPRSLQAYVTALFDLHAADLLQAVDALIARDGRGRRPRPRPASLWQTLLAPAGTRPEDGIPALGDMQCRAMFLLQDPCFFDLLKGNVRSALPRLEEFATRCAPDGRCTYDEADFAPARCPPAHLDYYFLSGFLQNIIDFLRQDVSEVQDGTDPIYPPPELPEGDSHFMVYTTQTSLYEIVSGSRSLNVGRGWIGTCPYLFLVHLMTLHNENLVQRYEGMVRRLIEDLDGRLLEADFEGDYPAHAADRAFERFRRFRLQTFTRIAKHRYFNVLRYDTERTFYESIERVRGIAQRQDYWAEVVTDLEKTLDDVRQNESQKSDKFLERVLFYVTFLGIAQVLFQMVEFWFDGERAKFPLGLGSVALVALLMLVMLRSRGLLGTRLLRLLRMR